MVTALQQSLSLIRERATNDTEVGKAFERLSKVFFETDATQTQQYSKVWEYSDWAKDRDNYSSSDIGIDLVAKLRGESGYAAIQCKFYQPDHSISKTDLDSFISASSTQDFKRLVLMDTSTEGIGKNAQLVFDNLEKEYSRIQLTELEESRIDWLTYVNENRIRLYSKKELRDHQIQAVEAVKIGLEEDDRGKLIMACGTGKTFTSLRIAESLAGRGKNVLYMVPSLALMSQSIREWKNDAINDFTAFSACSDTRVGNRRNTDDQIIISLHDLAFPATTDAAELAAQVEKSDPDKMTVVFSTYHSIDVISRAQFEYDLAEFDLIICDEAHRTTGATLIGDDESNFVRIHSNENVQAKKRLYMTATPRIYGETAKKKADEGDVSLASMDDENTFGKTLFHRGFGWAVENNLLTDYKVVVLAVNEAQVSQSIQRKFTEDAELKLDDATKIVGCYKALAKIGFDDNTKKDLNTDSKSMKRALAFCQNIELSKILADEFNDVVTEFESNEDINYEDKPHLDVRVEHIDGTFNADRRTEKLSWLSGDVDDDSCRVLSNVRCLTEGVDVPALDAIMFLHPRKSQIDIVQAVGRVMRKSEDKDLGYIILPITVAPGIPPEVALRDNEKYKVVWQILNALRAHDERFDSTINRIKLGEDVSERIEIVGVGSQEELDATTAVIEDVKTKATEKSGDDEQVLISEEVEGADTAGQEGQQLAFVLSDLSAAINAKIVEKCGTRDYWENWANDIASIAQKNITRINAIVLNSGTPERETFLRFLEELRDDLNPEISETDAVEMLAQHIITKPVFDSLFHENQFTSENAISKAMESVLGELYDHNVESESKSLERFYASVKRRSTDVVTLKGRQQLILELYDRFFKNAFPLTTQKLGIVYTPVEVVDFIINSVNDVLEEEFDTTLGDKNVHILDPFVGTGTFITRLLQSGLIPQQDIKHKYMHEIHANEIVLLAYYIAAINIEAVYQDLINEQQYQPFNGVVLTDTFQLYEQERDMVANLLPDNSNRRTKQKVQDITVIMSNPPYSIGQSSENDSAANTVYFNLNNRIEQTYSASSKSNLKKALYDNYIRSFRWASDRIGDQGVIAFVTNAGWIDGNAADGFRKCLVDEFSKIYIFHLRGNARTSGELRRKEKGNVFGEGTKTPIAITILVKNPNALKQGQIYFNDIGDYLDREQKLAIVHNNNGVGNMKKEGMFQLIKPDENNDWINQGDKTFGTFFPIGNKGKNSANSLFKNYSLGLLSGRDAWIYNFSEDRLNENIKRLIDFYSDQLEEHKDVPSSKKANVINRDKSKIAWTARLIDRFTKGDEVLYEPENIIPSLYRPFTKMALYFNPVLNERVYQNPKLFPNKNAKNLVIMVSGIGAGRDFSALMADKIPNLHFLDTGQCFPLKLYENQEAEKKSPLNQSQLFSNESGPDDFGVTDSITDEGLRYFLNAYNGEKFTKEDLFYFVYGLLHSTEYKERFKNNLSKELPRIPAVKHFEDFMEFSRAGRKLGELHVNFETVKPYPVFFKEYGLKIQNVFEPKSFYRVNKMKFAGKRPNLDKTTVIYNNNITIQKIPTEAYEYVVNGKSALEWVMERQVVKTDKASGIVNDANDYANETMNNPAYPLELFQRVITVSLETMKIVRGLPKLDI